MQTVQVNHTQRLFPVTGASQPQLTPLSVIDSSVARYSPAAGIWFYTAAPDSLTFEKLTQSLKRTLSHYPQYCGQLRWAEKLGGRLALYYGATTDPGVALAYATCSATLKERYPSYDERSKRKAWTTDDPGLFSSGGGQPLALHSDFFGDWTGLPCVVVQLTQFACGGFGISLKMAHVLSDTSTLAVFMRSWAYLHQNPTEDLLLSHLAPIFLPSMLDEQANPENAAELVEALPMQRWDLWSADTSKTPVWMAAHINPLPHCLPLKREPGTPVPWESLNPTLPTISTYLHFDQSEIKSAWREAMDAAGGSANISQLDALLAKVWSAVIAAKRSTAFHLSPQEKSSNSQLKFHLGCTVGVRQRLQPALPDNFLGSPTVIADVSCSINDDLFAGDASTLASSIAISVRNNLTQFTAQGAQALIHEMQSYESPSRYWNAYLGDFCTVFTSWVRQGVYDVQFSPDLRPYYVEPLMPRQVDGVIQIMESGAHLHNSSAHGSGSSSPAHSMSSSSTTLENPTSRSDWTTSGATVYLSLESNAFKLALKHIGR